MAFSAPPPSRIPFSFSRLRYVVWTIPLFRLGSFFAPTFLDPLARHGAFYNADFLVFRSSPSLSPVPGIGKLNLELAPPFPFSSFVEQQSFAFRALRREIKGVQGAEQEEA